MINLKKKMMSLDKQNDWAEGLKLSNSIGNKEISYLL